MRQTELWNTEPGARSEAEWKALLDGLIAALADFLGRPVRLIEHWIEHVPEYRCHSVTSKIESDLCPGLARIPHGISSRKGAGCCQHGTSRPRSTGA